MELSYQGSVICYQHCSGPGVAEQESVVEGPQMAGAGEAQLVAGHFGVQ